MAYDYSGLEYKPYEEQYQPYSSPISGQFEKQLQTLMSGQLNPAQTEQLNRAYQIAQERMMNQAADMGMAGGGIQSFGQKLMGENLYQMGQLGQANIGMGMQYANPYMEFQAGQNRLGFEDKLNQYMLGEQARQNIEAQKIEDDRQRRAFWGGLASTAVGGLAGGLGAGLGAKIFGASGFGGGGVAQNPYMQTGWNSLSGGGSKYNFGG